MHLPGLKTLLVPIDGGESSRRAKNYAVALAKDCGAKITLFHAQRPISARISVEAQKEIQRKELETISVVLRSYEACCREAGIEFTTVISTGSPADAIVRAAQESNCNMIVMGSRGRIGLRKVFGSIADIVSAHSSVPVVVVGDECVCSNHYGTSGMNVFEFKPVPNLQNDLCAC